MLPYHFLSLTTKIRFGYYSLYMNYYKKTTQVPNILLDHHLKTLTDTELRVLLTIIRKTVGQIDPDNTNKRLDKAWISRRLFSICSGKSERSISSAVDSLTGRGFINVTDSKGRVLTRAVHRKGALRLFYALNFSKLNVTAKENKSVKPVQKLPIIKPNSIKPSGEPISLQRSISERVQRFEQLKKNSCPKRPSQPL